jgi:hypothetical protein
MGKRTTSTEVTADTTLVTTAETVIATLSDVSTSRPGGTVRFRGEAKLTTGGSTTAVTLRVRRDSVSGTVVDESNAVTIEAAAGSTEDHDIQCDDSPSGEIFGATYVLTAQQTGAAANGTAIYAYLAADCD